MRAAVRHPSLTEYNNEVGTCIARNAADEYRKMHIFHLLLKLLKFKKIIIINEMDTLHSTQSYCIIVSQ